MPALEDYVKATKGYETNKYRGTGARAREAITTRWRSYIEKYGYAHEVAGSALPRSNIPSRFRLSLYGRRL